MPRGPGRLSEPCVLASPPHHYALFEYSRLEGNRLTNLKRLEFFVLVVLADGPRHGYGIVQDVERVSGGTVRPRRGTCTACSTA